MSKKYKQTTLVEFGFPEKIPTSLKLFRKKEAGKRIEKQKILPPAVGYRWFFDIRPRQYLKRANELRKSGIKYVVSVITKKEPTKHGRRTVRLWFKKYKDARDALSLLRIAGKVIRIMCIDEGE
jgi:hypothetical protein